MSVAAAVQDVLPFVIASLNDSMKQQLGQQYSDLIRICSYERNDCSNQSNFHYMYNPTYGNCFTFNFGKSPKYYVENVGPDNGLRLLLHASQDDYSCTSEKAGFRIAFSENNLPVYPESEGFYIPPGSVSYITIGQSKLSLLGKPYHNCADLNFQSFNGSYTVEDCFLKCFQNFFIKECQCEDPRYPLSSNADICPPSKQNCLRYITSCLYESITKQCNCPPPCSETIYNPIITTVNIQTKDVYKETFCRSSNNINQCEDSFNENFAILYVYYVSRKSFVYDQVASYTIINFINDFTGVTGLLLGVCAITIPEVVYLLFSLFTSCLKKKNY